MKIEYIKIKRIKICLYFIEKKKKKNYFVIVICKFFEYFWNVCAEKFSSITV